jgi:hypothetical protein
VRGVAGGASALGSSDAYPYVDEAEANSDIDNVVEEVEM